MKKKPIWKKSRRLGFSLLENKKEFSHGKKRLTGPGQHGDKKKRAPSLFSVQNTATQVICGLHLLKEKQLKNLFTKLKDKKGNIREDLLTNLESRLGNLIFRSGLVNTSRFARQWVVHGHFLVNGKKVDKPNYLVKPGDTITLEEKMRNNELIKQQLKQNIKTPTYLEVDKEKFNIVYSRYPSLEEAERGMDIFSVISRYKK